MINKDFTTAEAACWTELMEMSLTVSENTQEDAVLYSAKTRYMNMQEAVMGEIEGIMNCFPFIAKSTLRNKEKLDAYLDSLSGRMNLAKDSLEKLQAEIATMIGE